MAGPVIVIARGARAGLLGSGRAFEGLRAFLGSTGAFGGGAEMLAHGRSVGARVVQRAPAAGPLPRARSAPGLIRSEGRTRGLDRAPTSRRRCVWRS
jgi:hypothetical protein